MLLHTHIRSVRLYYIYILKNPITNLPFYIGVGKKNRKSSISREQSHIVEALNFAKGKVNKSVNKHKLNTILQILSLGYQVDIEFGNSYDIENLAFEEEIRLIAQYGRRDLGTGILTNMSDGGEGVLNPSIETLEKRSNTTKGRASPLKGVRLGPYSEERKQMQKSKMKQTRETLTEKQKQAQHSNRSNAQKGHIPWNKGLTKESDMRVAQYADKKIGISRPDMIGNVPWNTGLTKDTDLKLAKVSEKLQGREAPNKGKTSPNKGKTYAEIYGLEKANELIEKRRLAKIEYWSTKYLNNIGTV